MTSALIQNCPRVNEVYSVIGSPLARALFHPQDDPLMTYLRDDNLKVEPVWYAPIIPMLLVNGADGIGTGWMTKIPNHNPREIIENIHRMIRGDDPLPMVRRVARGSISFCETKVM